jgi:hypothetical protein
MIYKNNTLSMGYAATLERILRKNIENSAGRLVSVRNVKIVASRGCGFYWAVFGNVVKNAELKFYESGFISIRTDSDDIVQMNSAFELFRDFDILDRRVLIEKTGCL